MRILEIVTSLNLFDDDLEEEAKRLKERHLKEMYGEDQATAQYRIRLPC